MANILSKIRKKVRKTLSDADTRSVIAIISNAMFWGTAFLIVISGISGYPDAGDLLKTFAAVCGIPYGMITMYYFKVK